LSLVTVLGGNGAIGRRLVGYLGDLNPRVGSRGSGVNALDAERLDRFVAGSAVVVSCLPAALGPVVARAAIGAGAHFVDLGHHPLPRGQGRCVLGGAGMSPGLSGLLAHHLTDGFHRVDRLASWTGGRDQLSVTSAADLLEGRSIGRPGMCLRAGTEVAAEASSAPALFHRDAVALPFLSDELMNVARACGCLWVDGWTVVEGASTLVALASASPEALAAASLVDCEGHRLHHRLAVRVQGRQNGEDVVCTLVVEGGTSAELSAAFAACVVRRLLRGAADVEAREARALLDPQPALTELVRVGAARAVLRDVDLFVMEEGEL
jgi:hypothetical protein